MLVQIWFIFNIYFVNFCHFGSVNLSSIQNDSLLLFFIRGLVISAQVRNDLSIVFTQESPWVSNVHSVALFSDNHYNNGTRATSVKLARFQKFLFGEFDKFGLNSVNSLNNGLFWISWETLLIDDIFVKIVSQEITAACTSMAIINGKKCGLDSIFIDV